jgi:hypothetical protein
VTRRPEGQDQPDADSGLADYPPPPSPWELPPDAQAPASPQAPQQAAQARAAAARTASSQAASSRAAARVRAGAPRSRRSSRRSLAALPYLLVLAGVVAGLAWAWQSPEGVRGGTFAIAGALFVAALARLVLPPEWAGMLASGLLLPPAP